jgi:DNA repair protein RadC
MKPGQARNRPPPENPRREGPVDRLLLRGPAALGEVELLAVILGTGRGRRSGHETAAELFIRTGGLRGFRGLSPHEVMKLPGVGRAAAARLAASVEIGLRVCAAHPDPGSPIRSSRDVHGRVGPSLASMDREIFLVLGLSSRNRIILEHRAAEGCLNECPVSPRDVFGPLLRSPAASAILVHNHPSGDPAPSSEDRLLTLRMCESGRLLGIRVLDHIIVGAGRYYSFRDDGAME